VATSRTFNQLGTRLRLRALQVRDGVNKIVKLAAGGVVREVVFATPVHTGLARSNWIASLGTPSGKTISPHSPGNKLGRGESANAIPAIRAAVTEIRNRQFNETVFITNNLDYIGKLNNGSSTQAPANFVAKSVQVGAAAVRAKKIFKI